MRYIAIDQKKNDSEWWKCWEKLSSKFENRIFNDNEIIYAELKDTNEKCFLVAYNSKFQKQKELNDLIANLNTDVSKCFLMCVDGDGLSKESGNYWLHYSRTPVGSGVDLSHLSKRFELLGKNLEIAKTEVDVRSAWHEFDKIPFPETLTAAYLLMVTQEKKIGVPLNFLPDKQWNEACYQFKEIGGDKNADWSNFSEWDENKIGEVKKKIAKVFSQVASQTR